ncbi:MAG: O-antigen polymerase [Blastomonas sp.]
MVILLILGFMVANGATSIFFMKRFLAVKSSLGIIFCATWTLHYVVGAAFSLLSIEQTFNYVLFSEFAAYYIAAMITGQYFIWVYGLLLLNLKPYSNFSVKYTSKAIFPIGAFYVLAALGAASFAFAIGIGTYFSTEMAQNRSNLGALADQGIGVYYYLGTFLVPASMIIGTYIFEKPSRPNLLIGLAVIFIGGVFLLPLGGRGRVILIVLTITLTAIISRNRFQFRGFISPKMIVGFLGMITLAYLWGAARETSDFSLDSGVTDWTAIFRGLAVDLTRLQSQSFIFENYSAAGTYFGFHYIESLLGPFAKFTPFSNIGLIDELSQSWYFDTLGIYGLKSAISPSFIGEIYMNFGLFGLILSPGLLYSIVFLLYKTFANDHPLSLAVIAYVMQFSMFNGGLYAMFDLLVLCMPVLLMNKFVLPRYKSLPEKYKRREMQPAHMVTKAGAGL